MFTECVKQNPVFERTALTTLPSIQDVIMPNRNRLAPQDSWWLSFTLKNKLYILNSLPLSLISPHLGVNLRNTPSLLPPISQYKKDIPFAICNFTG